jgi:hypothetical protein
MISDLPQQYEIIVRYWSDHNRTYSVHHRTSYRDAMAFWRKQCRTHNNADVVLQSPTGHKVKSKEDSWPHEYGSTEGV